VPEFDESLGVSGAAGSPDESANPTLRGVGLAGKLLDEREEGVSIFARELGANLRDGPVD
jgi:hypothetical protein